MNFIELKQDLDGVLEQTFKPTSHKARIYQDKDLFWLCVVLTMLNFLSLREKSNFLKEMQNNKQLNQFYQNIGLDCVDLYPKHAIINRFLLKQSNKIQDMMNLILSKYKKELTTACVELNSNFHCENKKSLLDTKYKHYALDGKQIINCNVQTLKKSTAI